MQIPNQEIQIPLLKTKNITLYLKREDTIHPYVSGNKYRKLKYNLLEVQNLGYTKIITYGGAYSNHIAATAYAGKMAGLATVGVIRGEELQENWIENPTLQFAKKQGMEFHFVTREVYRQKETPSFNRELLEKFGRFYSLPEGGSNALAVKGCEEILTQEDKDFNFICCAVGTGGTVAGLINAKTVHQKVLGFPALKGDFLKKDIRSFVSDKGNWDLVTDYHFGGYAKVNEELIQFINTFMAQTGIQLDPIYTGKMLFGIMMMVKANQFPPKSKILAIHTGGLQGIQGMNQKLKRKNLPIINV